MGLVIILLITAFYYLLGRIGSKTMIWISAFILTTISNSYANLYMDFVSDEISRHQKYFIEFSGMISIAIFISFWDTLDFIYEIKKSGDTNVPSSFI